MSILLTADTSGGMEAVTTGITAIMNIASTMLNTITGNPIFAALFATGFIGIGIGIVKKLKRV